MTRWPGLGDDSIAATVPAAAMSFLAEAIGAGRATRSATLEDACTRPKRADPSRLAGHARQVAWLECDLG